MTFVGSDECARLIIQFWIRLRRTMSTTEIDDLNNFSINSDILELASRIQCCETAFQCWAAIIFCTLRLGGIIYINFAYGKFGTTTCAFQESFNFPFQIKKLPQRPRILLWVSCGVKGFSETQAVDTLFLKFTFTCLSLMHWSVVRCCASLCFGTVFRVTFSTCWAVMDNRLFGRILCRNSGSLPDMEKLLFSFSVNMLGNVTIRDSG